MDWRREGDTLEAIFSLLVSLAGLAERAAGAPLLVQLPVLAFLAHGEAVARSFMIELPAGAPAAIGGSRVDDRAARLAADLRALARLLHTLLARARRRALFAPDFPGPSLSPRPPARQQGCAAAAPPAPDTS